MFESKSDANLLKEVLLSVKTERQGTLIVLEYLAEIDLRQLWLREGYASLFDFCVRYLHYSEGEASRRIQAARCVSKVPRVKALLKDCLVSLSGISLIAPYLTLDNADTLLPLIENKTTREIQNVLYETFPESKPLQKFLKLALDDELEALLQDAQTALSEKDLGVVLKQALKKLLKPTRPKSSWPKKHTRYVPLALQREVRKTPVCSYSSASGVQCNQTAHLHVDHIRPYAKGGSSWDASNLRILCRAHNLYLAKKDFPRRSDISRKM